MVVTVAGIMTSCKLEHPLKASALISVTPFGRVILAKLVQFWKVLGAITVNPCGKVTFDKFTHP